MERGEKWEKIINSVILGNSEETVAQTKELLRKGVKPIDIINDGLSRAMITVGERFAKGEIFLIHMMLSANAIEEATRILEPILSERKERASERGVIVIGTVQGDIHDIGKNVVSMMLKAEGFKVIDLGKDVSVDNFLMSAKENSADIIAMSALLTTTMTYMTELIEVLKELGTRDKYKIMVGGSPVTEDYAKKMGADAWGKDALEAAKVAKQLMALKK